MFESYHKDEKQFVVIINLQHVCCSNKNHLTLIRKKNALGQKQVAILLSYKTNDQISRYERGVELPTLKIALKFGIIYQLPIHFLFYGFYENCLRELKYVRKF